MVLCCSYMDKRHVTANKHLLSNFSLQVSYSAVLYYGYIGVIGAAVWAVLKYFKSAISLAQIWCTYGAHNLEW